MQLNQAIKKYIFLVALFVAMFGSLFVFPSLVLAQNCDCTPDGSISDQGCMAYGCPVGTRRRCYCGVGTGGACTVIATNGIILNRIWSCFCEPDAACDGSGGGGGGTIPGCTIVAPNAPTQTSPANGTILPANQFNPNWQNTGTWGNGCPTTQSNNVQARIQGSGDPWTDYGSANTIDQLQWNTTYVWRVRRSNGGAQSGSGSWTVTTGQPPQILNYQILPSSLRCSGSTYTGRSNYSGTNNPLVIQFDVFDPDNNFSGGINRFRNARFAIMNNGNDNRPTFNVQDTLHDPVNKIRSGFLVRLQDHLSGTYGFAAVDNSDGSYGADVTSGNLTNAAGNVTLMGLNTADTNVTQVNNQTLRIKMTLRFENTQADNTNTAIHLAVISRKQGGVLVSQNPNPTLQTGDGNMQYTKFQPWNFDMSPPSATMTTPPQVTGANTFSINWQGSDNNPTLRAVNSYCYSTNGSPASVTINGVAPVVNLSLGTTAVAYPSATNCWVNSQARLGNRFYTDNSGLVTPGLSFNLHIQDVACNEATATAVTEDTNPWIMTARGATSALTGFSGFDIRNVAGNGALPGGVENLSYLSTYLTLAGNSNILSDRRSRYNTYGTNYQDNKYVPPAITGQQNWYQAILGILNGKYTDTNTVSYGGNMSTVYGVAAGSKVIRRHTGNLSLSIGTTCNVQGIILVTGALTINPILNVSGNNRCVFIVQGNITVGSGLHIGALQAPGSTTALYDTINGLFITNGQFLTSVDRPDVTRPADGLYIRGGVIANTVDFNRDLGRAINNLQPAEIIDYDPTLWSVFGNDLGIKQFSLREQ